MQTRATQVASALAVVLFSCVTFAKSMTRSVQNAIVVKGNTCLDAPKLISQIESWLGRTELDKRLLVTVGGNKSEVNYQIRRSGKIIGKRTFTIQPSWTCQEIQSALSLAIAVALEAAIVELSEAIGTYPLFPADVTPDRVSKASTAFSDPKSFGSVETAILYGVLDSPTVSVFPAITIGLFDSMDWRFSGLITGNGNLRLSDGGVEEHILAIGTDFCIARSIERLRLHACAGGFVGRLSSNGYGYAHSYSSTMVWLATDVRLDIRWELRNWFGVSFFADGIAPFRRAEFNVKNRNGDIVDKHTVSPLGVACGIGPSISF